MVEEEAGIDAPRQVDCEGQTILPYLREQRLLCHHIMLLSSHSFHSSVEYYIVGLHVEHSSHDIAHGRSLILFQFLLTEIRDPCIRSIQVDRHLDVLQVSVVDPHAISVALEHQATHLKAMLFQYFSKIFQHILCNHQSALSATQCIC